MRFDKVYREMLLGMETPEATENVVASVKRNLVFCRDCKRYLSPHGFCAMFENYVDENDFCSMGVKK